MKRKKSKKFKLPAKLPRSLPDARLVAVDEYLASIERMNKAQLDMAYWLKRVVTDSPAFIAKKWLPQSRR